MVRCDWRGDTLGDGAGLPGGSACLICTSSACVSFEPGDLHGGPTGRLCTGGAAEQEDGRPGSCSRQMAVFGDELFCICLGRRDKFATEHHGSWHARSNFHRDSELYRHDKA